MTMTTTMKTTTATATATTEDWVRITYSTQPENELSEVEKAARKRLETAINRAVEQFHEETTGTGLLAIELYPCDDDCCECRECRAA
jgi:hypothetical protein